MHSRVGLMLLVFASVVALPGAAYAQDHHGNSNVSLSPITVAQAVVADAGPDQIVEQTSSAGAQVTLDGRGSRDGGGGGGGGSTPTGNLIQNGSFETRNFTNWVKDNLRAANALIPWRVGTTGYFNPPPGAHQGGVSASNGFDGAGPFNHFLYQDVALPAGWQGGTLSFWDRIQWYHSGQPRTYQVLLKNTSGTTLEQLLSFSTTPNPVFHDLGWQQRVLAIGPQYAGQTIRIYIDEYIPERWSGPATLALDDFVLEGMVGGGGGGGALSYLWREGATVLGTDPVITVTLPLGVHTITLTVTDAVGNSGSDDVVVTVRDTTRPVLTYPDDITVEQATADGTPVSFACIATDICDADVSITCTPPSGTVFPLGTTVVTCVATDASGNSITRTFTVTVVDTTAPQMTFTLLKNELWPPNHKLYLCATLSNVYDICDADPLVDIKVASNQPINGPGDGNTLPDWIVVHNGDVWEVWLRAERAGPSPDREYSITATVTDFSGNQTTASATVKVAHDQAPKPKK